jgi:multidrug efflux pump subunit AcrA (membrane-fusion protein)
MKIKGLILPIAAGLCAVYAAVSIAQTQPERILTDPPQPPPRSSFEHTIAAVGLIEPSSESIAIGSHRSGVVTKVKVRAGEQVAKGQILFTLDHRDLDASRKVSFARIAQSTAEIGSTRALLDQAKRRLDSANALQDPRALSAEERADRASEVARLDAQLASSEAAIALAKAELESVETEITRSTVTAPIDATVLQVRVRQGEFIEGGSTADPRLVVGLIDPLHLRADIDEFEIARLKSGAQAIATPRGDAGRRFELEFVRYEPLVIPKRSLTGDSTERVDTRILQAIYRVKAPDSKLFVGQQMDVFIESNPRSSTP